MQTYVAFMRAINVGGRALVKMTDLQDAFESVGCRNVRTFIQSGNVVFDAPEERVPSLLRRLPKVLRELIGGEPQMVVRTAGELERLVKANPFKNVEPAGAPKLYVTFLAEKPKGTISFPVLSNAECLAAIGMKHLDVFIVSRRKKSGFYGFPNNFIEKALRTAGTTRNWSTVTRIVAMVRSREVVAAP